MAFYFGYAWAATFIAGGDNGTWLMMHSSAPSAAILLVVAINSSTYDLLPHGWLKVVKDTSDMLYCWYVEAKGMEGKVELFR
ncbi:hypothetical protein N7447_004821 [Penicillium robsamsonii]|uniref:uncharacterized protein n=1 Tax=Penicillium robsamsonii TaxID=1792511 RepID=UPI0025468A7E|nr:uncharacterized protein N7447_004821 [Penicillium robsamsonii]KAJ5822481.1 hypothetical protein N7447_004821 [Penicillium robsamsonii]